MAGNVSSKLQIFRAAESMVRQYGRDARLRSAMRAEECGAAGETEGYAVWSRVTALLRRLDARRGRRRGRPRRRDSAPNPAN